MPGALADELDAWGNGDLIDLNADEADWSKIICLCVLAGFDLMLRLQLNSRKHLPATCPSMLLL